MQKLDDYVGFCVFFEHFQALNYPESSTSTQSLFQMLLYEPLFPLFKNQ